jgi:hypothetical protein
MARCQVSNFALDCGEDSGCAILVVRDDGEAIDKAIFVCSTNTQMGVFSPAGDVEFEAEGSARVEFACNEIELESLAKALDRIHPHVSIGIGYEAEERGEKTSEEHMTGTLDEVIDALGLERRE